MDGMGVHNIMAYYKACVLDQLIYWWTPSKHKTWVLIEATSVPHKDSKSMLNAIKLGVPPNISLIPKAQASIKLWMELSLSASP